ncbi:hypothetical protein CUR178_03661 [Leishmania enriettii]|uniref:NUP-1 protein n=1 Tax=Leishmania enriettii TaxID=5663 RepID=A0A836HDU0_LEIEN|nr:hypothetical protein CUR178_03661 [Leishmania enriettii]
MWDNSVYKAGAHQQSSLRPDGLPISFISSGTALSPHSHPARLARPPPAGVLSADLARPISVRELAQSRVPAVPPPAAPPAPRPSATTAGFAGFGIPTSPVIYAATSGVSTSQLLSVRADASDLTSLAHRDIDHLSRNDLYNYASHLQDASKQYSGYLLEAYTKRDQYRSEVAHLKEELHNRYMQIDVLRREQERASDALLSVREENAQLREKLAEAEGHARNMQAKMSVLSGADPSVAVHFYQSQLALKDAQLRELQQGCERAAAASSQRRGSSTTAADRGRLSTNISSEGAAATQASPPQDLPNAGEVQDGTDAASAPLHITLEELQCLNTSLGRRLEEEQISHKAALVAHAEASATAAADRAQLLDTIAQLRQQCTEMQAAEDELVTALTQRAPVSKKDYEALQASYDDLTAALAKAEAHVGALQEKAQQHHQSAQNAQEELRHSLSIGLEERQALQARYEHMESLVNHLQRELELAERANQLRQEQLDAALNGNQQLAEHLRVAQEQLLSATSELQDLRKTHGDLESQLRELRQQKEGQEHGAHRPRHHEGDEGTELSLHHTPASSADREAAAVTRPTLESEIATLRSERDALVVDRDDIMEDVQRLREERLALLQSPSPQAQAEVQNHLSAVKATVDTHADSEGSKPHDHLAALEAAYNCIEHMKQTIAALTSEHDRIETELKAEVTKLEGRLASQSSVLDQAEASAAPQQNNLEEVMVALRDELLATQAQEKRLRVSEEALFERCGVHQRSAEQLQAHLMELEGAARHAASSLAPPQSAQPRTGDSESNVVNEALESLANQLGDAQRQIKQLADEHARTVEELARATRAVAELEARAADAEGKREASHTPAEGASVELTARIAALMMENAQLKEKLSASRAAVTTFASKQMDGESAAASLEELCAAEARRREAAEAEVSVLRAALGDANAAAAKNAELLAGLDTARSAVASERAECAVLRQAQEGMAAELTEVLQRSEEMQATLECTLTRLAEQEALVERLSTESVRLQDELAAAQESVLLLRSERDAFGEEAAQLHGKLAVAENRASDLSAAQQRLQVRLEEAETVTRSREAELSTALAALDRAASEVCDAEQKLRVYTEAKEQLADEHARTVEELARATRAVAELEARAADAEGKREASHTPAEGASVELTARIAALMMENAQLKEKLSASRAAVTTFASKQMDGESAAASLEELCAAEARRREAAEAEVSVLRAALGDANAAAAKNAELLAGLDTARSAVASERAECAVLRQAQEGMAAELTEVLQRSEEMQATLECTLTRLAEQEALVERLSTESVRLQDELAAAQESVLLLRSERDAFGEEAAQLHGKLAVAENRASDLSAAQQRLQVRLEEAETVTRSREAELSTALAALDRAASEVCDAEQKLRVYTEAKEQLADEHARTVEELARATRAVAELEARAADAEGKREASHTPAEGASVELTARIAALMMENAQLKEKLSASRAAVTTFASKQMDGESAAASLEELCAAEARRREAAEAEVSVLRAALGDANAAAAKNAELLAGLDTARSAVASERAECAVLRQAQEGMAAELTEVLQRSEEMQATLECTLTRLAEQEALVERLSTESVRLQDELAAAQESVLLLRSERDAFGEEAAQLHGKLAVAENRASDLSAAQQRLQVRLEEAETVTRSREAELSTALAALDRAASEVCDAEQKLRVYTEAKEQLADEHARTVEELARATRAVAELEARAADAEGKREASHTPAEGASVELTARIAALMMENAQLKEKLSASRAAVTTFASKQMDGESAAASLEELCAAEARRREAAEAEVSVLRAALGDANAAAAKNAELLAGLDTARSAVASERAECAVLRQAQEGMAAELTEVLQRSEEMQATLECTLTRLAEQEALVERLSTESVRLQDELAAAQESVLLLRSERDAFGEEAAQLHGKLAVAENRASDLSAAQQRLQVRLEEAETVTRSREAELSTALAALDRAASEVCDAEQKLRVYTEAKEQLADEHARTVEELARATRAVAELEARAADAEGKREASHTPAEGASVELTARIAALMMENAQLKEKLSASRAAVTTFASKQMDGESAAASLEELCAAEARRREAAEAEVSVLRAALGDANAAAAKNAELLAGLDTARSAVASERAECAVLRQAQEGMAAELTEVLQRSEEMQATLECTLTRLAEQEALVERLSTESVRLQDELAAAQESVLLLRSERDAFGEEAAQLHGKLAVAENRASDLSAAQQRLQVRLEEAETVTRSREAELSTALAALDRAASEVCDAEQKLRVYTEAKEQLADEHARTVEELARATRAVAELEARAADAEGKREASHTPAEGASVELTARIAALMMENAQLKEKLSASRAAVTTFASKQMDGESAAASLEELCAAEARRREAAEAEVSVLRAALGDANAAAAKNAELLAGLDTARSAVASERAECAVLRQAQEGMAAELTEVLQRSEEMQATLECTLTRLAEQEALVERLNREALEFHAQRPALEREVAELRVALAVAMTDKVDVVAQLVATQKELDRAAEVHDEHYREEERLHEALSTTTSAFAVQTAQVRLGMAHVVDMSRAFCGVAEAVAQRAACSMSISEGVKREAAARSSKAVRLAAPTGDALISVKCLREMLLPWTQALEWVAAMEKRLDALDAGAISGRTSSAGGHGERRRRRRGRAASAEEEDEVVFEAGNSALVLDESFLCRAVPTSHAEAAFARWMDVQSAAANIIAELRSALAEREAEVNSLRSAMDALATELMDEQDRADNLSAAIDDATEKIASAQAEFEEQLRQRTAATTAEVVEARRAEARATAAQLRAEERLTVVEDDLKEQQALLRNLQDENRRLTRKADCLLHSSRLTDPDSRDRSKVGDSATPQSLSPATPAAEGAAKRFATAASAVEAVEEALILQVSSLQADLMLSRRHARELEGREATVRQACLALEQQVSELRVEAADTGQLREDFAALRADYTDLEQRYDELERMTTAAGGGTMQELKHLRQQLKVQEAELCESKARLRGLVLRKATPELAATRRQEALRESLSGITAQLAATQAQYGGCTGGSGSARSRGASLAAAVSNSDPLNRSAPSPSSQDVLTSRIEHLQLVVRNREMALDEVQAAQLESRAAADTLEDQLAMKTAALERAEGLVAEYADTINTLTMTVLAGRGSRGARPTTTRPVRSVEGSPHEGAPSPSVPPLTPLSTRTRAARSEQPHAVAAEASPAPRMPSLDEVADDNNCRDSGKGVDSPRSSSSTPTPSATRRRTGTSSNREGAEGSATCLPSSSTSTKRSALSSPSNGSGRKSLAGATMRATTRKRDRSRSTA